VMQEGQ